MSVAFNSDVSLTVEIAFDSNPLDATQTFTDVSTYVRNIDTYNTKKMNNTITPYDNHFG